jgi:protocatechuate 3,4-dioxygenase beta subunit
MSHDRRHFLSLGSIGVAASVSALTLPIFAQPTEASGELGEQSPVFAEIAPPKLPESFKATEDNILGPYHRKLAPFRAKVTPPLEPGEPLVVRGRVWGIDSRQPLAGAIVDVWQANATGRYDNDDPDKPPKPGVFVNRARVMTDETGYYEYETIKPGRYMIGPQQWRPAHIHYWVSAAGYKPLVTQLYFKGDPYNKSDDFIKPSLIIDPTVLKVRGSDVQLGTFDIVLAKA